MNRALGWAVPICVVTALAAVRSGHGAEPNDLIDITFVVQVCEVRGGGVVPDSEFTACEKPISKAQVRVTSKGISLGPVMTSNSGVARLGPVRIKAKATFGIAVSCEEHESGVIENLRIDDVEVHDGEVNLRVLTTLASEAGE